ncbi:MULTISPECIES: hypothetical protein [unclassified Curtobacterium]|uniref:hypothetical protein n=1 Tax=unclassified Curtobacterium TaxID=257496 RepID=UPI000D9065C9|nr:MULTISPECIES: hypothetical protein [unclassified Curtobacterium]PYY55899.1 hypothetical protein DEJ17_12540 [Curtobacterium sp. MCSS17_011]WIE79234.1 hypothetical protein DEJ19_001345 [Curtobacterium sp. MCSS17_016]
MANESTNDTPNTPDISETELRATHVDKLRERAKDDSVGATSGMKKDELVDAIVDAETSGGSAGNGDRGEAGESVGAGPDGGEVRHGSEESKSLKYSQEVTSPDEDPEREGRSLVTTSHEVIKQWAEARGGRPATVDGTEHGDHLGVLRFDFGEPTDRLREVTWDDWFATFDDRRLNFIYQEQRSDGTQSNFFRFDNPEREDA